ncbi:HigA family addiction module antitoxin [Polynucleobacter hallstattensis]|uniref:HigA family addiction module antitoxin n=1 Tax=Polynucleobacter hallstattensis TaxID=1855586 RepID=UPI001C0AAC8B|nr:HigA family addiction module antitoxin [Polynucleobacter hallstattensis]MBU3560626.1 HigA family addiction module antidote protein [Polynucleobacter hallstattensis]
MHNPPHPGLIIKEDILPALGMGVTEAAHQLGISSAALSYLMNGRSTISPDMALRLEKWLGIKNGGSADVWLSQQAQYDQWHTRKKAC